MARIPTRAELSKMTSNDAALTRLLEQLFSQVAQTGVVDTGALSTAIATNSANIATNTADIAAIVSSGSLYSAMRAEGNTSDASIDGVTVAIQWQTPAITSVDATISGSEITINNTGTYRVTVDATAVTGGRLEINLTAYIDTGSGFVQETAGTGHAYAESSLNIDRATAHVGTILALTAGDILEFRAFGSATVSANLRDEGTRVMIERVL